MSSLRCKKCGEPVSDAYSKQGYCIKHGKEFIRLSNLDVFFRALTIFFLAPILVAVILSLLQVSSQLTLYYVIAFYTLLSASTISLYFINRVYIKRLAK